MKLSQSVREKIDYEVAKYPKGQQQSAVMSALRIVQDEQGWIDTASIDAIAEYLAMSAIAVYEVASFYNMYNLKPVGKYKLTVCTNLPCALSGGNEAAAYIKQKLGIEINETTADGRFTLQEGECMGACGDAPVMLVSNRKMCSFMSHEAIDRLLEELK